MKLMILTGAIVFFLALLVLETGFYAYRNVRYPDRRKIRKRLKEISLSYSQDGSPNILKRRVLSEVPGLNALLAGIPGIGYFENLAWQANVKYPVGFFALLSLTLAASALLLGPYILKGAFLPVVLAFLGAFVPFLYLLMKKRRRMAKFERQLPEGLDLIARSLRAGHAFTLGMRMAAEEYDDPLGPELKLALDEINFGISVEEALKDLAERIDCPDLRYFVVSVILQRETGGNLAEILESISRLIRERFKLRGKIKALSAEGKLSAIILVALPFFVIVALRFTSPEYIKALFSDPIGKVSGLAALFLMLLGILVMKKIVTIRP